MLSFRFCYMFYIFSYYLMQDSKILTLSILNPRITISNMNEWMSSRFKFCTYLMYVFNTHLHKICVKISKWWAHICGKTRIAKSVHEHITRSIHLSLTNYWPAYFSLKNLDRYLIQIDSCKLFKIIWKDIYFSWSVMYNHNKEKK